MRDFLNTRSYEKLLTVNGRMNMMQPEEVVPERH